MTGKLTPKQRRFVGEYLVDLNATEAAKRSGYSARTASVIAHENLRKPEIAEAIQKARESLEKRTEVTQERVIAELAKIGFANMADYMRTSESGDPCLDFSSLTRDQSAALSEVTVEDFVDGRGEAVREVRRVRFKLHDKQTALRLLGKHLGLFTDKLEVTGKDGGPIVVRYPAKAEDETAWEEQFGKAE